MKRRLWWVGLVGAAALAGYVISDQPTVLALVLPLAFGAVALAAVIEWMTSAWTDDERGWLLRWTGASLLLHVVCGIALTTFGAAVVFASGSDSTTYHSGAIDLIFHWTRHYPLDPLPEGKEGYFYAVAFLYRIFGYQQAAAIALNAVLGAALVPVMTDLTRRLFGREQMRYVPILVTCVPAFLVFTSPMLREAGVLFLIAVSANAAVRATARVSVSAILVMTGSLALLFTFRANIALIVTGALIVGIAVSRRDVIQALGTGAGSAVVLVVLVAGGGLGYSGYQRVVGSDLESINTIRSGLSDAESGFAPNVDVSTPNRALSYLPRGMSEFLLGPFPWQLRSARQLLVLPDMLIWWALLPSLVRGLMIGKRRLGRRAAVVLFPAAIVTVALSLLLGNYGTVVRERLQVEILLVPFIAAGFAEGQLARRLRATRVVPVAVTPFRLRPVHLSDA